MSTKATDDAERALEREMGMKPRGYLAGFPIAQSANRAN
jgi:hypothetical protein